jgi:hypothetical protein
MEAAPRPPPLESLPDLPAEEPAEGAAPASKAKSGPEAAKETAPPAAVDTESTQTLLKPEMLVGGDDEPTIPGLVEAPPEASQLLEVDPDAPLTLDSGFEVDRMLSAPPPPTPQAARGPTPRPASTEEELTLLPETGAPAKPATAAFAPKPASASPSPAAMSSDPAPVAAPALVPLAKRASLTAAAQKLAAASIAAPESALKPPPRPLAPAAPVAPLKPRAAATGAAASVTPIAKTPASAPPTSPAAPASPPAPATPPPAEAPSLASWANARAAAASSAKAPTSAAARTGAPAAKPAQPAQAEKPRARSAKPAPEPAASAASAAPAASSGAPLRGMDRDFIARNQVVERYLSGKLPIKAATDFERYCKEHPKLLDELGLPERVNAGLRLLEASGKPEPWQEAPKPIWQQPAAILGTAGLAVALALALALVAAGSASKTHKILDLQRQVVDRSLDAATSTRVIRLLPNRSGASNTPAIVIGGGAAQLIDFRIDESRSPYKDFRITIDRLDQGRVMVIDNLTKDSNGHLRVAVNSSAFGPGNYLLTIEGLTMRLEPQPDSWVTIGIAQR